MRKRSAASKNKKTIPLKTGKASAAKESVDLEECPRCGNAHVVRLRKLQRPSGPFTHFGTCDRTGEPLFVFTKDADPVGTEILNTIAADSMSKLAKTMDREVMNLLDPTPIKFADKLASVLYLLMRDVIAARHLSEAIRVMERMAGGDKLVFTSPHLEAHARELTNRIIEA